MSDKGEATKSRIVEVGRTLILKHGYVGTILDDILRATGLTKGAFFHHFRSKAELGRAVVQDYADSEEALFKEWFERADRLSEAPRERLLIFLKLLEAYLDQLEEPLPGCLFASYVYEAGMFDAEMHAYIRARFLDWQRIFELKLASLLAAEKPVAPVTARGLAEMIVSLIQGAFIMGNSYRDPRFMQRQSAQFRQYIELLFPRRADAAT